MGASASVRCTCYEDGRATPPPVAVRVDEFDQIVAADPADRVALLDWRQSACEHVWMEAADVSMNWAMLRSLRAGLEAVGGTNRFPVLLAHLPEWNGAWYLSPSQAAEALGELQHFAASFDRIPADRLVTGDGRGGRLEANRGHPEWWQTAGDGRGLVGMTGRGTFAVWPGADLGAPPLFESARFTQHVLDRDGDGRPATVELTDLDTGETHRLAHGLSVDDDHPAEWRVVTVDVTLDEAYPLVEPLRDLLELAVSTGRHVEFG